MWATNKHPIAFLTIPFPCVSFLTFNYSNLSIISFVSSCRRSDKLRNHRPEVNRSFAKCAKPRINGEKKGIRRENKNKSRRKAISPFLPGLSPRSLFSSFSFFQSVERVSRADTSGHLCIIIFPPRLPFHSKRWVASANVFLFSFHLHRSPLSFTVASMLLLSLSPWKPCVVMRRSVPVLGWREGCREW